MAGKSSSFDDADSLDREGHEPVVATPRQPRGLDGPIRPIIPEPRAALQRLDGSFAAAQSTWKKQNLPLHAEPPGSLAARLDLEH